MSFPPYGSDLLRLGGQGAMTESVKNMMLLWVLLVMRLQLELSFNMRFDKVSYIHISNRIVVHDHVELFGIGGQLAQYL